MIMVSTYLLTVHCTSLPAVFEAPLVPESSDTLDESEYTGAGAVTDVLLQVNSSVKISSGPA